MEEKLKTMKLSDFDEETLRTVKKMGFTDAVIANMLDATKGSYGKKKRAWHLCRL